MRFESESPLGSFATTDGDADASRTRGQVLVDTGRWTRSRKLGPRRAASAISALAGEVLNYLSRRLDFEHVCRVGGDWCSVFVFSKLEI